MSESLRFGLERPGWRGASFLFLLGPFAGIGMWFASEIPGSIHGFAILEKHASFSGTAHRETEVVSPLGKSGVGWVGVVGYRTTGKGSSFVAICGRGELTDLRIVAELSTKWLTFLRPGENVSDLPLSSLPGDVPSAMLGLARGDGSIPPVIAGSCEAAIAANRSQKLVYREAILKAGDDVEVVACERTAGRFEACHDGYDFITTSSRDAYLESARRSASHRAILALIWNFLIMGIAAVMIADKRIRAKGLR